MKLCFFFFILLSFSLSAMNDEEINQIPTLDFSKINLNDRTSSPRKKRGMSCPPLPKSFGSDNLRSPTSPIKDKKNIQE